MAHNSSFDSREFTAIDLPYDRIQAELSDDPRFIRGSNSYVTLGGKLCKRPGNLLIPDTVKTGYRTDRLWVYETLETPPKVYIIASMYNTVTAFWEIWALRLALPGAGWGSFANLRHINQSTRPHEAVASRGLFYIKSYPDSSTGEKLGTVFFDGTDYSLRLWGILPPTAPAALVGAVARSTADVSDIDLTLPVSTTTGFPVAPFTIQVEYEQMTVTAVVGLNLTVTRGVNGTTASAHVSGASVIWRDWTASDHQVDVNLGWAYTYAFKTANGQVSSRAPLETNPDKLPSRTGPFQDLIPKFTITGDPDTGRTPKIVVFRSTDGGGTYYLLEEIDNPGGGSFVYSDDSLESGAGGGVHNDPLPDYLLDQADIAPTLTSNSPPPTVISPAVVGTDDPIASTPIAGYAARLWYGIGNILFFSGQEEITLGVPEECWPSGTFGNFFRFQYPITNVSATSSALYVFTLQATYELTGTNLETFNVKPIFENLGHPYGHPRAITRYEDTIIFLAHDYRIAMIQDSQVRIISDPLYTDIVDAINNGAEFDIKFWGDLEKEWIVVGGMRANDSSASRQWIYDIKKSEIMGKPFWNTPWTMRLSCLASGRISETSSQRRLILAMYNTLAPWSLCLSRVDPTGQTGSDYFITGPFGFIFSACTNLFQVPAGNHVNKLRQPGITPVVYDISLDRNLFGGDNDPLIQYYLDDYWSDPIDLMLEDPARIPLPKQYKTLIGGVQQVAQHVAVEVSKLNSIELFESCNLIITYTPDMGA